MGTWSEDQRLLPLVGTPDPDSPPHTHPPQEPYSSLLSPNSAWSQHFCSHMHPADLTHFLVVRSLCPLAKGPLGRYNKSPLRVVYGMLGAGPHLSLSLANVCALTSFWNGCVLGGVSQGAATSRPPSRPCFTQTPFPPGPWGTGWEMRHEKEGVGAEQDEECQDTPGALSQPLPLAPAGHPRVGLPPAHTHCRSHSLGLSPSESTDRSEQLFPHLSCVSQRGKKLPLPQSWVGSRQGQGSTTVPCYKMKTIFYFNSSNEMELLPWK